MEKELAKRLQDAGFPHITCIGMDSVPITFPLLQELIDECGYKFYSLTRRKSRMRKPENKEPEWYARGGVHEYSDGFSDEQDDEYGAYGNTPEEAVGELWLQIHQIKSKPN